MAGPIALPCRRPSPLGRCCGRKGPFSPALSAPAGSGLQLPSLSSASATAVPCRGSISLPPFWGEGVTGSESHSPGCQAACLRQQLPPPQALCGFLWHLSLGQSAITSGDEGPWGTRMLRRGVGMAGFSAGAAHPAGTEGSGPTTPHPQPPLRASSASTCASRCRHLSRAHARPALPGAACACRPFSESSSRPRSHRRKSVLIRQFILSCVTSPVLLFCIF